MVVICETHSGRVSRLDLLVIWPLYDTPFLDLNLPRKNNKSAVPFREASKKRKADHSLDEACKSDAAGRRVLLRYRWNSVSDPRSSALECAARGNACGLRRRHYDRGTALSRKDRCSHSPSGVASVRSFQSGLL